jgi:hypothetical protein
VHIIQKRIRIYLYYYIKVVRGSLPPPGSASSQSRPSIYIHQISTVHPCVARLPISSASSPTIQLQTCSRFSLLTIYSASSLAHWLDQSASTACAPSPRPVSQSRHTSPWLGNRGPQAHNSHAGFSPLSSLPEAARCRSRSLHRVPLYARCPRRRRGGCAAAYSPGSHPRTGHPLLLRDLEVSPSPSDATFRCCYCRLTASV